LSNIVGGDENNEKNSSPAVACAGWVPRKGLVFLEGSIGTGLAFELAISAQWAKKDVSARKPQVCGADCNGA